MNNNSIGKYYYSASTKSDSWGQQISGSVRAFDGNQHPSPVSASKTINVPLFVTKDGTQNALLTSVTVSVHTYSQHNYTGDGGSGTASISVKAPDGTELGSISRTANGANTTSDGTTTVSLLGKTSLENADHLVISFTGSASASGTSSQYSIGRGEFTASLTDCTYLVKS